MIATITPTAAVLWLVFFAAVFAAAGLFLTRRYKETLETYTTARNSQSSLSTMVTLLATSLGAWILFSPAETATWGGITAVIGYALGGLGARLLMIPLGRRMRKLMPHGHSPTEFALIRYGRGLYIATLLVMLLYMVISLIAEITAIAMLVQLLAPVSMWVTATIVMLATLAYTLTGGIRATILTDKVQMAIILPLLAVLCVLGWQVAGGAMPVIQRLQDVQPELVELLNGDGIAAGWAFFIAVMFPELFHQGNWQRVYVAKDLSAMRRSFFISGIAGVPIVLAMGLFGLLFVAQGQTGDASIALFSALEAHMPVWVMLAFIPLGLALVMSTADTILNAVASMAIVDVRRVAPKLSSRSLLKLSKVLMCAIAVPVVIVAAKGLSVLYLFLLADLFCAAAAFPVFLGLFTRRYSSRCALTGLISGLAMGFVFFPMPSQAATTPLLPAFAWAAIAPVIVIGVWQLISQLSGRRKAVFDNGRYQGEVAKLD